MSPYEFYQIRAEQCAREAGEATLNNVRERALRAEAAWREMAMRAGRVGEMRDATAARKAAEAEAALS
ncbi:MAG: hypothetical protein H0X36_08435 [Sphingomonadaceae bacterium]|nr:hypothetical protein [Sphingomonadaceae bacterium]